MKRVSLSRKLTLETRNNLPDGAGGTVEAWTQEGVLWGDVQVRTARVRNAAETAFSTVRYRIFVRAAPSGQPSRPEAGQRFREGTRVFRIESVAEWDPDGRYLVCNAKEERVA